MSTSRAVVVVAVLALVLLLPFFVSPWPVGQDLPAHIETAAQIVAVLRGDVDTNAMYALHALPWPNSVPTLLMAALLPIVGGVAAGVVVTSLGVVLWPVALAVLLACLKRPPLLAVLALPTCYDLSFSYGFTHFVVGKPLWALTMVAAINASRHPSVRRLALLAGALVLLFHTHLLLWASAVPLVVVVCLVVASSWRTRRLVLLAVTCGAAAGAWWSLRQPHISGTSAFPELSARLMSLWDNLGNLRDGSSDGIGWWLALLGAVVVLARPREPWRSRETLVGAVLFLAPLLFALVGPTRTPEASIISERFWSVACALALVVAPTAPLSRRREVALATLGLTVSLSLSVPAAVAWRRFATEQMGDFQRVLDAVPAGARVATSFVRPLSPWARHNALWHWPKLVSLRGATTDDAFAWRATCVLGLRDGVQPPRHPIITRAALSSWTHLLLQGSSPAIERQLQVLRPTLLVQTGEWRLFSIPHAP